MSLINPHTYNYPRVRITLRCSTRFPAAIELLPGAVGEGGAIVAVGASVHYGTAPVAYNERQNCYD